MCLSISRKSCCPDRSLEDDDNLTVELHGFGMCKQNLVALRLVFLVDPIYIRIHTETNSSPLYTVYR